MNFADFCQALDRLEGTSSRNALLGILSDLLQQVSSDEVAEAVYLLQGQVGPAYDAAVIGMAENLVAQGIAAAFNRSPDEISGRYRRSGDLGDVACALAEEQGPTPDAESISLAEVVQTVNAIAGAAGSGASSRKVELFSNLLRRLSPLSARYFVRLVLGRLRLGIGDPTILAALAEAKLGSAKQRKVLEGAYNRTSDLGLIATALWNGGAEAVEQLSVRVGNPIRSQLAERLPTPDAVIARMGEVDVQYKYDGFRVQIHKDGDDITIFSRNLRDMTEMFPELVDGARREIKAQTAILDGEALAYNPLSEEFSPFQETMKRRRKYGVEEMAESLPLTAFIFDIMFRDGEPLVDLPLRERLKVLREAVPENGRLMRTQSWTVDDADQLAILLQDALTKGLEGLVVKRRDSPYEAGARNFNWVKLKRHSSGALRDTIDCVVLGYFAGRGKRADLGAGALLVGLYDQHRDVFVTVSRIGTGLTDEEWREVYRLSEPLRTDHRPARVDSLVAPTQWIEPAIVVEILADEITRSPVHTAGRRDGEPGYALRFPRLISFRGADKQPEDATTVDELLEMHRQQAQVAADK